MTKMFRTAAVLGLGAMMAATTPGFAALSGFYDSAAQIRVILDSDDLANALRQLPITDLDFDGTTSDGLLEWKVDSADCDVSVFLKPIPPQGVGATGYEVAKIGVCD